MTRTTERHENDPALRCSPLTGRWYVVTSWRPDGSARHKVDVSDQVAPLAKFAQAYLDYYDRGISPAAGAIAAPPVLDALAQMARKALGETP